VSDTRIYFGTPGSLITLFHPRGGVQATRVRPVQEFALGNGERRTRRAQFGSREYTLSWESLQYPDFATLQAFDQGHNGPGPFVLLDPGQRNQLTVNQAAATSELNATDNFTIAGSGSSIASSTTLIERGPRALAWTFQFTSPSSGSIVLDSPYLGWFGIPVVSRPYVFNFLARGGGTDGIVTIRAEILWYGVTGTLLGTTSGSSAATSTGAWAAYLATATPPASTAYAICKVTYVSGASAGSIVYISSLQFEEGSTAGTWRPGTGVRPVSIVSLEDRWPWLYADEIRSGPAMVLREDGR
jgi:hypothetical protein